MRLVDWMIKLLVNYKYKKNPFMTWTWGIDEHIDIVILSAEYYDNYYRYGVRTKHYESESEDI